MLERISPVIVAAVLAGGFVVSSAFPAGASAGGERLDRLHAERPVAADTQTQIFDRIDIDERLAAAAWYAGVERAAIEAWYAGEWYAGVERAEAEAAAEAARLGYSLSAIRSSSGSCNGDVQCFLECTRAHESDTSGGYGAVSSSGTYRGAYQFSQVTWDAAVAGAGHAEYAGMPADQVPGEIQDAAAAHLYSVSGTRPWGGRC
jgi:hypothetical protein